MKILTTSLVCFSVLGLAALAPACGASSTGGGFNNTGASSSGGSSNTGSGGGNNGQGGSGSGGGGSAPVLGGGGGSSSGGSSPVVYSDGGIACPAGLQCNVSCSGGGTTSISGKVYDPAMKNPLYNVAVYVPAVPLVPLPKGVPTGSEACSCGALFQSGAITNTTTDVTGAFTLTNVPVGSQVPLVIQIGKWRRLYQINVTACQDNAQADKSIAFLGTVPASDTNDSIPDIAVSTGGADTLECLMLRIGIPASEYVAGGSTSGHVHVFSGGNPSNSISGIIGGGGGGGGGSPEEYPMTGAPQSSTSLWDTSDHLMPYDIVLLSCEGEETYNANPANLESYLNAGGRAFASHFQYSWFSGPIDGTSMMTYSAPSDWGNNLASWSADTTDDNGPAAGVIDTTLNSGSGSFSKGTTLAAWLAETGALGGAVAAGDLPIYSPRYNASVTSTNAPSQPWITSTATSGGGKNGGGGTTSDKTMYFSFDTPVNAPLDDAGVPSYCGRAVFSDLHVSGDPSINDLGNGGTTLGGTGTPPPAGCDNTDLSPQEKALEFMLFDLSSCVLPDTIAVPVDAGLPPPPQQPK